MDRTLTPALSQRKRETGGWGKSGRGANGRNGITSVVATKLRVVPRKVRAYACRRETPGNEAILAWLSEQRVRLETLGNELGAGRV